MRSRVTKPYKRYLLEQQEAKLRRQKLEDKRRDELFKYSLISRCLSAGVNLAPSLLARQPEIKT